MTTTRPTKTAADTEQAPRSYEALKTFHASIRGPGGASAQFLVRKGNRYSPDHPVVERHPGAFRASWELHTAPTEPLRRRDPEAKTVRKNRAEVAYVARCTHCDWQGLVTDDRDQAKLAKQQHHCPPERPAGD